MHGRHSGEPFRGQGRDASPWLVWFLSFKNIGLDVHFGVDVQGSSLVLLTEKTKTQFSFNNKKRDLGQFLNGPVL